MALDIGSRGGIGERDVWEAADALLLAGARPTVERVRAQIGRGSPNTVTPLLDGWFKALGGRIQNPAGFRVESRVSAMPRPVDDAATQFWEAALAAARTEIEAGLRTEREALAREHDELEQTRAEFAAERSRFEGEMRAQQSLIESFKTQIQDTRAALDLAQAERAALISGQHRMQSQHEHARTALETELLETRKTVQALREEISAVQAAADREMKDSLLKIDRARTEAVTAQKALTELRERASRQSAEFEKERVSLQATTQAADEAARAHLGELEQARARTQNLQGALDAERLRNRELVDLAAKSQSQIAEGLRVVERLKLAPRAGMPKIRRSARFAA